MVELGRSYDSPKQNMSLMPHWCNIAHTILLEVVQPAVSSADFVATVANVLMTRRATVPIVGSHWHGGKVAARPFLVDAIIDESSQGKTGKWKMTENVIWYVWWKCQCHQQLVFVAIPKNQHAISWEPFLGGKQSFNSDRCYYIWRVSTISFTFLKCLKLVTGCFCWCILFDWGTYWTPRAKAIQCLGYEGEDGGPGDYTPGDSLKDPWSQGAKNRQFVLETCFASKGCDVQVAPSVGTKRAVRNTCVASTLP